MEHLEHLERELDTLLSQLPNEQEFRERLDSLQSVYPFNQYEYIISSLFGLNVLTLDRYHSLRDDYISRYPYLYTYEITSPTKFGITWANDHLQRLVPELARPSRISDPQYSNQYDFVLDNIRVEVKASRANDKDGSGPLYKKAIASSSNKRFEMNFQQMKPGLCDVFIWLAVWTDTIRYWVLSSQEVLTSPHYSKGQHRGNVGEGQLHVRNDNIHDFDEFEVRANQLADGIRSAHLRSSQTSR